MSSYYAAMESGAVQPAVAPASSQSSHAPRLAASSQSGNASQLAAGDSLAIVRILLTCDQLGQLPRIREFGGKRACEKQRELRRMCLQQNIKEVDMSEGPWEWKHLLKALDQQLENLWGLASQDSVFVCSTM